MLREVSFALEQGEVIAIVGPSGSGKTTLLHLVNRLLDASSGEVEVGGRPVTAWPPQALRRFAALAFQSAPMLPGTVLENLQAPSLLRGQRLPRSQAEHWLVEVGLPAGLLDQEATTLSGGQRQRVALLRTLALEPAILLVDEVTSALDSDSAQVVEAVILERVRRTKLSVLWVTHDENQARRVADRILRLEAGQITYLGPAEGYAREADR